MSNVRNWLDFTASELILRGDSPSKSSDGESPLCYVQFASGSELDEDTVDRVAVLTRKLISQASEKCSLRLIKTFSGMGFMMVVITIHHSDPSAKTPADSLNRVRTHEYRNIPADCPLWDIKLLCQIAVCIVPSQAQQLQQLLPPFTGTHAFTPFPSRSVDNGKR